MRKPVLLCLVLCTSFVLGVSPDEGEDEQAIFVTRASEFVDKLVGAIHDRSVPECMQYVGDEIHYERWYSRRGSMLSGKAQMQAEMQKIFDTVASFHMTRTGTLFASATRRMIHARFAVTLFTVHGCRIVYDELLELVLNNDYSQMVSMVAITSSSEDESVLMSSHCGIDGISIEDPVPGAEDIIAKHTHERALNAAISQTARARVSMLIAGWEGARPLAEHLHDMLSVDADSNVHDSQEHHHASSSRAALEEYLQDLSASIEPNSITVSLRDYIGSGYSSSFHAVRFMATILLSSDTHTPVL